MSRRVFILTTEPPDQFGGGQEHLVRELVKGLQARSYNVEVFHRENSLPRWLDARSGRFWRKIAGSVVGYFVGRQALKRLGNDVVAVISNSDVGYCGLKTASPRLKQIHFYHGTYRGQAEAIRPFITLFGYLYLKWWNSMVLEHFSGRGKLVLCNSDQTRGEVERFFGLKGATVWLPLDTAHFRPLDPLDCRRRMGLPEKGTIGFFVGNTSPMKNLSLVAALLEALPEVQWVLALRGNVPRNLLDRQGVRVFPDATYEELPLLYSSADFALCPSHYEPFGYVVAEALACGTPVIASPGGASRLLLRQPPLDRLLIPDPDAVQSFRRAILEVLADADGFRKIVTEQVRPKLEDLMAPVSWWARFVRAAGL